ncbi:unnamed protein product [Prorocentrum cordatum]|uniref:ATP-dependent RNA helicase DHX29-like UBA domain-containing protein n=1 Tax=Prorocentrum cordatum TaxID=2364126 RepID=A0ABN9THK8_9DINO|nr:unnamed protein product [Polarella glacialis]
MSDEQDAEAEAEAAAAGAPEGAGGGPAFEPPPRAAEGSAGAAAGEDTGWEAVAEAAEDGADVAELLGMGAAASAPAAPSASQAEGGASKESVEEEVARRVREEFEREEKREAGPSNCARMLKASANRVRESATGKIALPAPLEAKILDLMQSDSASEAATEDCVRPLSEPIFFDGEQLRVFSMLRYPPTYRLKVNSATRAYDRLYESHKLLESHGFAPEHVRAALEATLGLDLRAALEWLVLTLPPGAVPTPLGGEGGEAIKLYEGGKSKKPSKIPAAGGAAGGRPGSPPRPRPPGAGRRSRRPSRARRPRARRRARRAARTARAARRVR